MSCWKPKSRSPQRAQRLLSKKREDVLLHIPSATVHLMEDGKAVELARGGFKIVKITEGDVPLATVVRVGTDLQWPLTKDEPVVKLDPLHYLFTLPDKDGGFLNYGVSFSELDGYLAYLDSFLKDNACFSAPLKPVSKAGQSSNYEVYWKDYAPRVEDYNVALAKAIAGGTGEIVKGIFMCSNAYIRQVNKGAEKIQPPASGSESGRSRSQSEKPGGINKALRGVRKLSAMTEKLSQSLLHGVISLSESVSAPVIRSKAGQAFFTMAPGQVLLASLDALNKVMDALEVAQRTSLAATSSAIAGAVSSRYGESVGEATEDAIATAGHALGTAWNLLKLRKTVTPTSGLTSSILKNAAKRK